MPETNLRDDSEAGVGELARDIAKQGLLHPLVIDGENRVVAGARRLAALHRLKVEMVPVVSLTATADASLVALAENLCRENLTREERGRAFKAWLDLTGGTRADLARLLGVSASTITEALDAVEDPNFAPRNSPPPAREKVRREKREAKVKKAKAGKPRGRGRPVTPRYEIVKEALPEGIGAAALEPTRIGLVVTVPLDGKLTSVAPKVLADAIGKQLRKLAKELKEAYKTVLNQAAALEKKGGDEKKK